MKLFHLLLLLVSFAAVAFAWDKEDYEIFDLVSDLEAAEGKGTNFYSHLNIDPSASLGEINKAYRKKSLELHPDKNPGVKNIQERFARLGVISQILRSPERRERYNFFYKNGVPKWRGTGYYYSRYRPTLAHTLIFLVFLSSLFHRLVLQLNYNRDRRRVHYFQQSALAAAKNGAGKREKVDEHVGRRVRVGMVEGNESAGSLELVVLDEHVYLPHDDGSLEPLQGLASPPSLLKTWPVTLTLALIRRLAALLPPSTHAQLPAAIRSVQPIEAQPVEQVEGYEVSRKSRKSRSKTGTPRDTPRETPVTTDLESDDNAVEGEEIGENGEGKKKKRGVGKAGGARRRKMAMKK